MRFLILSALVALMASIPEEMESPGLVAKSLDFVVFEVHYPLSNSYTAPYQFDVCSQRSKFVDLPSPRKVGLYFQSDRNFVAYNGTPNAANYLRNSGM